jgi:hypothetical protein
VQKTRSKGKKKSYSVKLLMTRSKSRPIERKNNCQINLMLSMHETDTYQILMPGNVNEAVQGKRGFQTYGLAFHRRQELLEHCES